MSEYVINIRMCGVQGGVANDTKIDILDPIKIIQPPF